jgi:aldehyde:ferredoxin oxidoreductase
LNDTENLDKDQRENYFLLSGETLCQYLLRSDPEALVIARGPLPFISGNKTTVGYISPQTGLPHYSFVGGNSHEQLLYLGLDAICFKHKESMEFLGCSNEYIVIKGRAPDCTISFKSAEGLPTGQRSAYYWLLEKELGGDKRAGSVFTLGEGVRYGYKSANLGIESFYHAGRGGIGHLFARCAMGMVLQGIPMDTTEFLNTDDAALLNIADTEINPRLDKYCLRLSGKTGGTIIKMYATGANKSGKNTLPANNAQQLGCAMADLGGPDILLATREGQTGCYWCQVKCRHYHSVKVDYAPDKKDVFLDDFEPTYAIFAMLGLNAPKQTMQGKIDFLREVEERVVKEVEQLGCDIMDLGIALAALFEGVEKKLIPEKDIPDFLLDGPCIGNLDKVEKTVLALRAGEGTKYPALAVVGNGTQALADTYPEMKDIVFTGGKQTIGNAGHCNALWTFLMPFGRFFGHYAGQFYKVDEKLPAPDAPEEEYAGCFKRAITQLLDREFFCLLGNAISHCGFTFVIFSEEAKGKVLSKDNLFVRVLKTYGIHLSRDEILYTAQNFWAQSMEFKSKMGWEPPTAEDYPKRIYEALSAALDRPPEKLKELMGMLIDEWKVQAKAMMSKFGYEAKW